MKRLRRWLSGWLGVECRVVIRRRRVMSDVQRQSALAVTAETPLYAAMIDILDEAREGVEESLMQPQVARDAQLLAYYSGGLAHVDQVRTVVEAYRARAGVGDEE